MGQVSPDGQLLSTSTHPVAGPAHSHSHPLATLTGAVGRAAMSAETSVAATAMAATMTPMVIRDMGGVLKGWLAVSGPGIRSSEGFRVG